MKIDSLGIPSGNICAAFKHFLHDKLVFFGLCLDYLSLRTSAHAGVAIPLLNGTR